MAVTVLKRVLMNELLTEKLYPISWKAVELVKVSSKGIFATKSCNERTSLIFNFENGLCSNYVQ